MSIKPNSRTAQNNICGLCPQSVTEKKRPGISCFKCNKLFHATCLNLSVDCLLSLKRAEVDWACKKCKTKSSTRRSSILVPQNSIIQNLNNGSNTPENPGRSEDQSGHSLEKIVGDIRELMEFKTSALTSLKFYSDNFDDIKSKIDQIPGLIKRNNELSLENSRLKSLVCTLEERIAETEQQQISNELILSGIPEVERSLSLPTLGLVEMFCTEIGHKLESTDIRFCKRLKFGDDGTSDPSRPSTTKSSPKPPKILIKFYSQKARDEFKKKVRFVKRDKKFLDIFNVKCDYYVSDHLTKHFNGLLCGARSFAREMRYEFVWVSDSKIFIKRNRDSPVTVVNSLEDLKRLRQSS